MSAWKVEPHKFKPLGKRNPIPCCSSCGLLRLRNEFTDWCVKQGCNYQEHPEFSAQRNRAGRTSP